MTMPVSTHFLDETFMMVQGIVGTTATVLFIFHHLIHFHPEAIELYKIILMEYRQV